MDYSDELTRLSTFDDFPKEKRISSFIKLADSGFYYYGDKYNIKCFSCKSICDNLDCDSNPNLIHKELSPDCSFLKENFPDLFFNTNKPSYAKFEERLKSFENWKKKQHYHTSYICKSWFFLHKC